MAIIGTIRKQSGLAVIIVGVAIAAFVIGDFGKRRARGTNDIAVVDGEQIPYKDFSAKVEETFEAVKENRKTDKISDEETYLIRQNVYDDMIKQTIMGKLYDELGLVVSPEELFDQVQGKQPHKYILQYFKDPKTGQYDPRLVLNYLKQLDQMEPKAKKQWLAFEKAIKDDRQETKFHNLISKSFYLPKVLLKQEFSDEIRSAKLRMTAPNPYQMIPDSLSKITDADYQAFYDKNKPMFTQDNATRDIDYVLFEVVPSPIDRNRILDDVNLLYKDFTSSPNPITFMSANSDVKFDSGYVKKGVLAGKLDTMVFSMKKGDLFPPYEDNNIWYMGRLLDIQERPDTMKGLQCLIAFENPLLEKIKRTKDQAKAKADSLMTILKKKPALMDEYARTLSDFVTAKDDSGHLNAIVDGDVNMLVFYNEGMKMKPGDIRMIETRIGYAIFRLNSKSKPEKKVKAAIIARNIEPSNQTYQDTYTRASAFAGQNRTIEAFDKAAAQMGLSKREAPNVPETDNVIMGINNAREVVRWAYSENVKAGDISPVFDLQGKYLVAYLKNVTPKGVAPLSLVKSRIENAVKAYKKCLILKDNMANAMKESPDLYAISGKMNSKVDTVVLTFSGQARTQLAREPEVIGNIFSSPKSKLLGPFQGKYGVYAVIIDDFSNTPENADCSPVLEKLRMNFERQVPNQAYPALLKASKITDSRLRFY